MLESRSLNALNFYINHSKIKDNIMPDGVDHLDASEIFDNPNNRFFNYGHGAVLFIDAGQNTYKMDAYFLRKSRVKPLIQKAINEMDADIIAEVPAFNMPSRVMTVSLGFKRIGVQKRAWIKGGKSYDIIEYKLERQ